jgi:hypothetical protein
MNDRAKFLSIIEEIELDFIEFTGASMDEKKKRLPLKEPKQIKNLIWNLFNSEKWRKKISYKDYSQIIDIWMSRLKDE